MKFLIANLANARPESSWDHNDIIPEVDRPGFIHETREAAEIELLRLAKIHPMGSFHLFQCVAYADTVEVQRHVLVARLQPYPTP